MKCIIAGVLTTVVLVPAYAAGNKYQIERSPYSSSSGSSTDIEMRKQYDANPTNKYRGTMDSDGSARMRNFNGDSLRGNIDRDGYGRLYDQNGNSYRVKPR